MSIFVDGFDDAFIGMLESGGDVPVAVYNYEACIKILGERDGIGREGAIEYLDFNVLNTWMGEATPLFINPCSMEHARMIAEDGYD